MPEFLEDPSVLTKEKLKSELVANNVTLPVGEQRKDVYVQLYLQHLTARNRPPLAAGANSKGPPDFSSDEEREPTPVLGSGAAVAGRSRAAVGRVRTPGRGHKGGRLSVVAAPRELAALPPWRPPRASRAAERATPRAAGGQVCGGRGGRVCARCAAGPGPRVAAGSPGLGGDCAPPPGAAPSGGSARNCWRSRSSAFPALLTETTGSRVSERSLEGNW